MPITGLPGAVLAAKRGLDSRELLGYLEAVLTQGVAVELGALKLLEAELGLAQTASETPVKIPAFSSIYFIAFF